MAPPRILTFNFHEPYLCLMARTGLPFTVGLFDDLPFARPWQTQFRPVPEGLTFLDESAWRADLRAGKFDVVIAQNESNASNLIKGVLASKTPLLVICHNRRSYMESTLTENVEYERELFAQILGRLDKIGRFIFISESKRRDYGLQGRVILPGVDAEQYGGYTGEKAEVIRVGNSMRERNLMFDVDFQEAVCQGLPHRVIGLNPTIPGSEAAPSFDHLLQNYRSSRCMLHVTREDWEDGYNLSMLEAMATGMPVVSLANASSPLTDGVDGFVSEDADVLHARIQDLLNDPCLAKEIGARGRETVAERFPIQRFVNSWREVIHEAAEQSPRRSSQHPTAPAETAQEDGSRSMSILLHFLSSPVTTGRYFERASRKTHAVVTTGFRCPEAILQNWGFPPDPPEYSRQDVDLALESTYQDLLNGLPDGFDPELYLWVDSGPKEISPDIARLAIPKACYLIDTHLEADIRIKIAQHFNFVYLAQKAQVDLFSAAGNPRVKWLPLACSPELHGLPPQERVHDVAYVGRLQEDPHDRRKALLQTVQDRFPNSVVGQHWPKEMARIYAQSKIVVNACVNNDVNMRVFEAMASGALLITDEAEGLEDLFEDGIHCVIYRKDEDLPGLIEKYLADDGAREAIARTGQECVLQHHTYDLRMEQIVEDVLEATGRHGGIEGESRYHVGGYYRAPRPELACHVPPDARRILDVGCGAGEFGRFLKERGAEEVAGIEIDERAYHIAQENLDHAVLGNIEEMELPFPDGHFDCIVFGDVLEHLINPTAVLRKVTRILAPQGIIVTSIPNVRFFEVVGMLAQGRWKYEDAGILDRTHLRFFTAVEIRKMIHDAGLQIRLMKPISMMHPDNLPRNPDGGFTYGRLTMARLSDAEYQDFLTYQYLVTVERPCEDVLGLAQDLLEKNKYVEAFALVEDAENIDPVQRTLVMAKAVAHLGKLDTAEDLFREVLKLEPNHSEAQGQLGIVLVAQNRPDRALSYLEQAVAADPEDHRVMGALGLAHLAEGRKPEAYAHFKEALELSLDNEALLGHFVEAGQALECDDEIEDVLRRFVDFYPGNTAWACRFADFLVQRGKTDEARDRLETVLLFQPDHLEARKLLDNMA